MSFRAKGQGLMIDSFGSRVCGGGFMVQGLWF